MKTDIVKLGDGREYTITEFDVGDFINIEDKFGNLQIDATKIKPVIYWLWLAVRKAHEAVTLEKLYKLIPGSFITDGGINTIFDKLSKLNGWDKTDSKNVPSPAEGKTENK